MIKTIMINDKELTLSNNVGWAIIYREQFGKDIVPVIMPGLRGMFSFVAGLMEEVGDIKKLKTEDFIRISKSDSVTEAFIYLSGLELVDFIQITWAMAKEADDNIPDPKVWLKEFDEFPLDILGPAVLELTMRGLSSSKNWERLQKMFTDLKPKSKAKKTTKNKSE